MFAQIPYSQDEILTICASATALLHEKACRNDALRVTVEWYIKQPYFIKTFSKMPVGASYIS